MLAAISLYRLPDFVMGPMNNPFYADIGIAKEFVGEIRASIGLIASLVGIAAAGLSAVRFGFVPTLLAGAVLPLATAYAVSEAFGMPKGVNLDFRRGRVFFSLFTALIVVGVVLALIPNIPVMQLLVGVQVLNGALLPIILIFILLLTNDKHLTKELRNTKLNNLLAIGTLIMVTTAVVVMLGGQLWTWLGN